MARRKPGQPMTGNHGKKEKGLEFCKEQIRLGIPITIESFSEATGCRLRSAYRFRIRAILMDQISEKDWPRKYRIRPDSPTVIKTENFRNLVERILDLLDIAVKQKKRTVSAFLAWKLSVSDETICLAREYLLEKDDILPEDWPVRTPKKDRLTGKVHPDYEYINSGKHERIS